MAQFSLMDLLSQGLRDNSRISEHNRAGENIHPSLG